MGLSEPAQARAAGTEAKKAAPSKDEIRVKRLALKNVERRLGELRRDVEKAEAQRAEASRAVAEAERDVSKAARALRQTTQERSEAARQLAELEAAQRVLEGRIASRQEELLGWLRRNYMYGTANDVAALLAARDPNQFARDVYYLERLGQARFELIENLRGDLRLQTEQARQMASRQETLARLEEERRVRQQGLEESYARRHEALAKIETALETQRAKISALKADEERLTQVVDTLVRQAAEAAVKAAATRRQARAQQNAAASTALSGDKKAQPEPVVGKVREAPDAASSGTGFAQMRGKLRFPVTGELIGTFGAPRAGKGTAWRGVFIRAASGADVRAVSDGEVVYSDWLRGYGNLLIVDHGGGYFSIYGNNDALYKGAGDTVRGGEAIASVGASGAESESGLYFEIRHRGQALDPMQWVKLK